MVDKVADRPVPVPALAPGETQTGNGKGDPGATRAAPPIQPEARSLDDIRKSAGPELQKLAQSVGLGVKPAPTTPEGQVALATTIKIKLDADDLTARRSNDPDRMRVAASAKTAFTDALVKVGEGRLNFGIPGVTSSGETPPPVGPAGPDKSRSVVPKVEPTLQQAVGAVLSDAARFGKELQQLKPSEVNPQKATQIEQRATQLLERLRPLEQQLSRAEGKGSVMSDAAAGVKVAIANLEGYVKQVQELKQPASAAPVR